MSYSRFRSDSAKREQVSEPDPEKLCNPSVPEKLCNPSDPEKLCNPSDPEKLCNPSVPDPQHWFFNHDQLLMLTQKDH